MTPTAMLDRALAADSGLVLHYSDDRPAIDALRRDIEMWRAIAERWIGAAVEYEVRLLAANRSLREHVDKLTAAHRREQRLREELTDVKACWQRCAERLMPNGE